MSSGPISKDDVVKFKEELKNMTPEEFFKRLEEAPPVAEGPEFGSFEEEEGDDEEDDNEEKENP